VYCVKAFLGVMSVESILVRIVLNYINATSVARVFVKLFVDELPMNVPMNASCVQHVVKKLVAMVAVWNFVINVPVWNMI